MWSNYFPENFRPLRPALPDHLYTSDCDRPRFRTVTFLPGSRFPASAAHLRPWEVVSKQKGKQSGTVTGHSPRCGRARRRGRNLSGNCGFLRELGLSSGLRIWYCFVGITDIINQGRNQGWFVVCSENFSDRSRKIPPNPTQAPDAQSSLI